jgi:hypothetical protein
MRAWSLRILAALGLAAGLGGCNSLAYPDCYRVQCPYPPVYHNSYAGYNPARTDGRPAFGEPPYDDPFADYTQRTFAVNPTAGDTQAANEVLQTATPWPRYSSNTDIPGNGRRMVRAVHNFESGGSPPFGPPLPPPIQAVIPGLTYGGAGGATGGAGAGAPAGEGY